MKTGVVFIIEKKDDVESKILIGKKIIIKGHMLSGQWHIPGGGMVEGESLENAIKRESMEETGLDITDTKFLDENIVENKLMKWFLCKPLNFDAISGDDLQEVKWVDKKDVISACSPAATSRWPAKVKEYFQRL